MPQAFAADSVVALPPAEPRVTSRCCACSRATRSPLFNGSDGAEWPAEIVRIGRSDGRASASARRCRSTASSPCDVTLALGVPANDRMDALVEKAAELGAAAIQPLVCERSVVRLAGERAEARRATGRRWRGGERAVRPGPRAARRRPIRFDAWLRELGWPAVAERALGAEPGAIALDAAPRCTIRPAAIAARRRSLVLSGPEGGLAPDGGSRRARARLRAGLASARASLRADTAPLALLAWLGLGSRGAPRMNRSLLLLALCQGFFLTNNVTFIAINGLVGLALAPSAGWRRCRSPPTSPAARCSPAWSAGTSAPGGGGARSSSACVVAIGSTALCAWAALQHHFWLLVAGATLAGYYNANAGLYRFAATEIVAPQFKERAISWVLAGGIIGAVAGPNLARVTRDCSPVEFAGAYAALAVVALCSLATISWIRFPPLVAPTRRRAGRPLGEIVASRSSSSPPGLRLRLRRDEPADGGDADRDGDVLASVRQHRPGARVARARHVRAELLHRQPDPRFGALPRHGRGRRAELALHRGGAVGRRARAFLVALFALGVGWNFLFIGGTTLVTDGLPARGEDARAGGDGHDDLHDDDDHLVQLRRAGHDAGLDLAQPRLDRAGAADRARAGAGTRRTGAPALRARPA